MYIALASSDLAKYVNSKSVYADYSTTVISSVNYEPSDLINSFVSLFLPFCISQYLHYNVE